VGAFRVVSSRDLRDVHDRELDPRSSDLRHLRERGSSRPVRIPGSREHAVVVTNRRAWPGEPLRTGPRCPSDGLRRPQTRP
jgi:hypothetical protein